MQQVVQFTASNDDWKFERTAVIFTHFANLLKIFNKNFTWSEKIQSLSYFLQEGVKFHSRTWQGRKIWKAEVRLIIIFKQFLFIYIYLMFSFVINFFLLYLIFASTLLTERDGVKCRAAVEYFVSRQPDASLEPPVHLKRGYT